MIETKLLLRLGRRWVFKRDFVPPKLHRKLVFVLGVEEWHSSVLLFLPPAQDVWKLHPELSGFLFFYFCVFELPPHTVWSLIWVQTPASGAAFFFFPRFVFLWKWLPHRICRVILLVSRWQSEVCPKAGGWAGRTKLLWQIWIWPSVEEEVCISCHMRWQSTPFPSSVTAKGGKSVSSLCLTPKLNGRKIACKFSASVATEATRVYQCYRLK